MESTFENTVLYVDRRFTYKEAFFSGDFNRKGYGMKEPFLKTVEFFISSHVMPERFSDNSVFEYERDRVKISLVGDKIMLEEGVPFYLQQKERGELPERDGIEIKNSFLLDKIVREENKLKYANCWYGCEIVEKIWDQYNEHIFGNYADENTKNKLKDFILFLINEYYNYKED